MSIPTTDRSLQSQLDALARDLAATVDRAARLEQELAKLRQRLDGSGPRFAALYADFTDRFRGTTAEVTQKLRAYLADVDLVGASGFTDVEVRPLHPEPPLEATGAADDLGQLVGRALRGPRDYAGLGYQPAGPV